MALKEVAGFLCQRAGPGLHAPIREAPAGLLRHKRPLRGSTTGMSSRPLSTASCRATQQLKNSFLLQVHPDLLGQYPRERAINGENIKALNNFLDGSSTSSSSARWSSSSSSAALGSVRPRLVFYLKPRTASPSSSSSTPIDHDQQQAAAAADAAEAPPPLPSRVVVPLDGSVLDSLSSILLTHCDVDIRPPRPAPTASEHAQSSFGGHGFHGQQQQQQQQWSGGMGWEWYQRASGGGHQWRHHHRASAPPPPGPCLDSFLEDMLRKERRDATLAGRRAAWVQVARLQEELRGRWGFERVEVRCEWTAEYLAVSLATLAAALDAYQDSWRQAGRSVFKGLDLVLTQHDVFRDEAVDAVEGRVLLCPSDTPIRWVETLARVSDEDVGLACQLRDETRRLRAAFQRHVLPGCRLERGLTCSRAEFHAMLRRGLSLAGTHNSTLPSAEAGQEEEEEEETGVSRPWEQLLVRVEHHHRSRVLETGGLQLNTKEGAQDPRGLVGRMGGEARRRQDAERTQELLLQDVIEASQRPLVLGLAGVRRDPALSAAQAASCLSRLLMLHPLEHRGVSEALRGQELYIGRLYGLTREGAISVPWDWTVRHDRS